MYNLVYTKKASKYINLLDKPTRKRIDQALMALAESPFSDTSVRRMKGRNDIFRKRIGDYRAIFHIDKGELVILVLKVGSRGDIYKR